MDRHSAGVAMQWFGWYRRSRLWVVPTAGVVVAVGLAWVALAIDRAMFDADPPFPVFAGTVDTARSVLVLIATSIATLTALVLTIVAVVIQLATQALSPRAVRTFLRDLHSHLTIGTFVTTFTFAMVVLEQLHVSLDENLEFASISVTTAFVLAVLSLGMFISYVDHIAHKARVTSILDQIGNETRAVIEREYEDGHVDRDIPPESPEDAADATVAAPAHGCVIEVDVRRIVAAAARADVRVVLIPSPGDFLPAGAPVFAVHGTPDVEALALLSHIDIDVERTVTQDVAFGIRLLVDVAERSLSSGVNDPTTAVQVLDQLHDLLARLARVGLGPGWFTDAYGAPRLFVRQPTWDAVVALALDEIRQYGVEAVQVVRRLRDLLADLDAQVPEDRRAALDRQVRLLDEAVDQVRTPGLDPAALRYADRQGLGSTSTGVEAPDHAIDMARTTDRRPAGP